MINLGKERAVRERIAVRTYPRRHVVTYGDMMREIEYYEVEKKDVARFLGVNYATFVTRTVHNRDMKLPKHVGDYMTVLSMLSPVWVRNRIKGYARLVSEKHLVG